MNENNDIGKAVIHVQSNNTIATDSTSFETTHLDAAVIELLSDDNAFDDSVKSSNQEGDYCHVFLMTYAQVH